MPDRKAPAQSQRSAGTLVAPGVSQTKVLPIAFPLDDFYARSGLQLPKIEMVTPGEMPEPHRSLLAHDNDMTPTLSAFYAQIIHLRVLSRVQRGDYYFREVVLLAEGLKPPVEFGAIRINLGLFSAETRRHILDERVPLGHLLRVHAVPHSSRPKAFFRLESDQLMTEALELSQRHVLYGRRNSLLDAVGRPLAEVVEILPPQENFSVSADSVE